MKKILFICMMLGAGAINAQDIFQKNLYSADRVMHMRKELELTEAQAAKIKKLHSENAGKFSTIKWDLDDETLKLKDLLDASKIDAVAAQKQMDIVLALENSLKKQQLSTMISILNELSPKQQGILQSPRVQTINGVSVTGYGTGSFSSSSELGHTQNFRVGKSLNGSNGLAPSNSSSTPKIIVQASGVTQENAPLYMLDTKDGMKEIKDLSKINPNDIESINVIKDASAINTFGEKGKNGVIVIKLKENPNQ